MKQVETLISLLFFRIVSRSPITHLSALCSLGRYPPRPLLSVIFKKALIPASICDTL